MMKTFGYRFTAIDNTQSAVSGVNNGLGRLRQEAERTQQALARTSGGFNNARGVMGQFGLQLADTAVVAQMGQHPLQILAQQGSQMLASFGPLGAVLGGFAAVLGTVGLVAVKSGGDLGQLGEGLSVTAPLFTALGSAAQMAGSACIDAINLIVNNLDRLVIAGGVTATFFAVRYVSAFVMAGGATTMLTGAVNLLRAALVRLPLVGLVVVATELIYRFVQLVQATGSVGEAFQLVQQIGTEALNRLIASGDAMGYELMAVAWEIRAAFMEAFDWVYGAAYDMATDLRGLLGEEFSSAIGLADGIAAMAESINATSEATANAAAVANSYRTSADLAWDAAAAAAPLDAWERMQGLLDSASGKLIDVRDLFKGTAEAAGGAGGGAADAAAKVKEAKVATDEWLKSVQSVADGIGGSLSNGLHALVSGTQSATDAFRAMAADILKQLYDVLVVQKIVAAATSAMTGGLGASDGGILGRILGGRPTIDAAGPMPRPAGRATGGRVRAGRTYLVNENTPRSETFTPGTDGTVNRHAIDGGNGGIVINQTFNVSAGVAEAARAEIAAALPGIVNATRGAVLDATSRGKRV